MLHEYSGARLRALRKRARLTQAEVTKLTGVAEATLYRAERDKARPITATLQKLVNLYVIRIQYWKNIGQVIEETFYGGYIPSEAVIREGSPGFDAVRTEKETDHERTLPVPHGIPGIPR